MIVTGVPAAGRSETVNKLLEWLDPKYIAVRAFGEPDREDRRRPPMWRYWRTLPAFGRIAFYFWGWYGDYFERPCTRKDPSGAAEREVERIRQTGSDARADGVRVVKIHLHMDADTQRSRHHEAARRQADALARHATRICGWRGITPRSRRHRARLPERDRRNPTPAGIGSTERTSRSA